MSVSSRSHEELWPEVCDWFEERSDVESEGEAEPVSDSEPGAADAALAEDVAGDESGPEDLTDGGSGIEVEGASGTDTDLDAETSDLHGEDRSDEEIVERAEDDVQEEPAEPGEMNVDEDVAEEVTDDVDVESAIADETDDLTDLNGVGQAYAEDLAEAGIETFEQLADADAAELAAETGISPNRIEDWIDQARNR